MLEESRLKQLNDLISTASKEELIWINGYLSCIVANGKVNGTINGNGHEPRTSVRKISLLFGTETGNSKKLATHFASVAKKKGIVAKITGLDQYRFTDLSKEEHFFVIVSTHGEGEPPVAAKKFYDHIHQNSINLHHLKYSVLALGDTSYPLFCKTGEDVDIQLQKLGASRVVPLQKCDLDFEADAEKWFEDVLKTLEGQPVTINTQPKLLVQKTSGKKFYKGVVLTNINLNDRGSNKETYHIEIASQEPVQYEPGDAFAIIPRNKKVFVEYIISQSGIDRALTIETSKVKGSVEELLTNHLNICHLLTSTIKKYAAITQQEIPDQRMDLVDLLRIYPAKDQSQFAEVIKALTPIAPRLYSISSSPATHSDEIHLTVSKTSFLVEEELRYGLCSEFLGELALGAEINFYIHRNRAFKLPEPDKDIIMIGPGTGIAPFRSFLGERDASGASGKNWLFFGEQHFQSDFLYQTEIQNYFETGVLNKVSLAFSRDQEQKIYVQHRMLEKSKELFDWLQSGAHVYISGTKDPMSGDVENTWLQIIEQHGNKSKEQAKQYWEQLKKEGRYQKDVY